jgi:hypothetical protein
MSANITSKIILTTVKSDQDNRALEKDDKGYYKVNLGGFNCFNSAGEFYTAEDIEDIFVKESSSFNRRLKSGQLRMEVEHPAFEPGMSTAQYMARNMKILLSNTCCHIREVILTPTSDSSGIPGQGNFILVEAWIKPSGPHGDALKASLDNPEENTAFSIRCLTANTRKNGLVFKKLGQVITWDWVLEPGISKATKWKKLSIESRDLCSMSAEDIASDNKLSECMNCSMEAREIEEIAIETVERFTGMESRYNNVLNWGEED